MATKSTFRVLESGEEVWRGTAYDEDNALDKCFFDENPGNLTYTLEKWGKVKYSRELSGPGWVKVWNGRLNNI